MSNPTSIAGRTRVSGQILTRPRRGCLAARAGTPGGRVALLVEGPARVGAFDDVGGVGVLFDDRVALVTVDDVLDLGQLVARHDRKAAWVFAHRLVLRTAETHQLVAAQPAAFTEEAVQRLGGFGGANALIDLAKRRLVHRHALLLFLLHPASLPVIAVGVADGKAHTHASAVRALVDHQLLTDVGDHWQPEAETGAVGTRRHPQAVVADDNPDMVLVDVERDPYAAGLRGRIAVAVGVDDHIGDRLGDRQVDCAAVQAYPGERGAKRVPGMRSALRERRQIEVQRGLPVGAAHLDAVPSASGRYVTTRTGKSRGCPATGRSSRCCCSAQFVLGNDPSPVKV